jgi:hypothetical protein
MTYSWNCGKTMLPIASARSEAGGQGDFAKATACWDEGKTLAERR